MKNAGKFAFFGGVVAAATIGLFFAGENFLPWLAGGLMLAVGVVAGSSRSS